MSDEQTKDVTYDIEGEVESFHWWFFVRRKLLMSFLSSFNISRDCITLDIGCGTGANLRMLAGTGFNVIGLDRSIYALSLTQKKTNSPLINGDVTGLPIRTESVGLIIAMDILEHLENDMEGIREFHRVLKRGGNLFLTVPTFKSLWGIQDVVTGHKRRYSKQETLSKLRQGGFETLRYSYFNFFLFFPILMSRRMMNVLGLKIESENRINLPMVNFFLKAIFSLEPHILKYLSFPFGVSFLCIAKKI
jgi:SAM-dependent methyltransferase